MKIQILLLCFFLTSSLFGQVFIAKYNPQLEIEKKIISDTIYWSYTDSLNIEHIDLYPQNSDIIFIVNKDSILIGNIHAKIVNDTLNIGITKISYGLQIQVLMKIDSNMNYGGEIRYWTTTLEQESLLKIQSCSLELNQNKFIKGQNLMGKIKFDFTGIIPEEILIIDDEVNVKIENSNDYSEKSGEIIGKFNVIIE